MNKADGILEKSRGLLQEGKFYEYEQKLKTLASRYYGTGKVEEATSLLLGGGLDLIDNAQVNSAYGLVNTTLEAHKEKKLPLDEQSKRKIITILSKAPWDKNKPAIINRIFQWFYPKTQDQDFLRFICEDSLKNKDFHITQKFLLRCDNSKDLAIEMLNQWMQLGNVNEKELFVARFILLKIACNRVEDAISIVVEYVNKLNYPIIQFTRLLLRAIQIKSLKAFEALRDQHKKTYCIDPSFPQLMEKIGAVHFGIKSDQEEGFMGSFMKFLAEPGNDQ